VAGCEIAAGCIRELSRENVNTSAAAKRAALSKRSELTKLSGNAIGGIGFTRARNFQACSRTRLNTYSSPRGRSQNGPTRGVRSGGVLGVGRWFVSFENLCGHFIDCLNRTSNARTSKRPVMLRLITSPDPRPSSIAAFAPRMSNDENRAGGTGGPATSVITKVKPKTKRPNLYRVLILNDDYTPMEFVVHVLEKFFQKDVEAATKIMLHVHHHGIGECGIFTYEIAETKVTQVMDFARKHQHPLQCVMEKK
jgi:ATP-dependent Clp protease adaptor protein ClpS